ncbi:RhoGAP domain-containing protein [Dictyostelium discoideum AX4]|uniref:Rho GTPase-activating protein gacY n=1 Tax=Dictyostelium discoideum TaxID=44689 RepID=GACY_DICDI|nr:RhoGAP domain-containing protein [Dictyostelium discoideum AX4]Q54TH9.1 RecName: Full=Rho GTPase-activating protein gacY; AltName: Full=GTPase activating factor for raC protein Y [Dictyostelium discoideum]EAL66631.1 RhoGAP domain-containing protein [Dictyostelium discoideum AX4]|eukprot:XP_640612.1 RhoGAP domain-containing protein [Dictyostelium discoideum AX4]
MDSSFKRASFKLPPGVNIDNINEMNNNNMNTAPAPAPAPIPTPQPTTTTTTAPQRKVTFGSRVRAQEINATPTPTTPAPAPTTTPSENDTAKKDDFDFDPVPVSRPRATRAATMIPSNMLGDKRPIRPLGKGFIGADRQTPKPETDNNNNGNNNNNNNNNDNNNNNNNNDDDDEDEDDDEYSNVSAPSWNSVLSKAKTNTMNSRKRSGMIHDFVDVNIKNDSGGENSANTTSEDGSSSRRGTLRKAIVIGTHNPQPQQEDDVEETTSRISSLDLANVQRPRPQYHTIDPASIPQWKKNNEDLVNTMEQQQQQPQQPQQPQQQQSTVGGLFNSILKKQPNNNANNAQRLTRAEAEYNEYLTKSKSQRFPEIEALNFIYPAGKDNLGRTIIVIIASHLPVREMDMERVLLYTISIMDPVVEEEYVLVYVHTNMNNSNKPSMAWMKKVYTIFNRKYKKNLKGLYIVHPTTWIKFTLGIFKHFLSSKFWKKLTYIDDLGELFKTFPREQLALPNAIMMHRPAGKKSQPIFGAPLEDVINRPDNPGEIPVLFEKGIAYLSRRGLQVEGLFRLSGANSQIKSLRQGFDQGEDVDLEDVEDVHTVAGLLKLYLRELPSPLFPFDLYSSFIEISKGEQTKPQKVESLKLLLSLLPPANKALSKHLFKFLGKVIENSSVNKMNSVNLSIVFAPNLLKDKEGNVMDAVADAQFVNQVVQLILDNINILFNY